MSTDPHPGDALLESMAIQAAASAEGFDWDSVTGVLDKVDEEAHEVRDALASADLDAARRELGDLLLVAVNLARFLHADPAEELRRATRRFANRYEHLKSALAADGKLVKNCAARELEDYWQHIKAGADEALRGGA